MSDRDELNFKHESYGMAGLSRRQCSGRSRMFASALEDHHSVVALTIKRCERNHHHGRDWFHGREQLIEIEFTAAQFAEFITNANVGDGIPCTIRAVGGKMMEKPPEEMTEAAQVQATFKSQIAGLAGKMASLRSSVASLMQGKTITQATRSAVVGGVDGLIAEITSHMPFLVDSFREATAKVATAAKLEVEAFAMHAIVQAGLSTLRVLSPGEPEPIPELPATGEPTETP